MSEYESVIEAPRSVRLDRIIESACRDNNLICKTERKTRFLREIIKFKVKGSQKSIRAFRIGLNNFIKDYNNI